MKPKIGLFSGTFDPVHDGHIDFAREAIKKAGLDKIFFLVEPRPRRKQGVKAVEHRIRMVQLAIKDEPQFGLIVLEQAQFTPYETLPVLQARFNGAELYMLMGDDMLQHLGDWPQVSDLIANTRFVIGVRSDEKIARNHIKTIEKVSGQKFIYEIFKSAQPKASSSQVRLALRRGQTPQHLDEAVRNYIHQNGLYTADDLA
jgi:nicotinate-nucleotide adenylyltransferase